MWQLHQLESAGNRHSMRGRCYQFQTFMGRWDWVELSTYPRYSLPMIEILHGKRSEKHRKALFVNVCNASSRSWSVIFGLRHRNRDPIKTILGWSSFYPFLTRCVNISVVTSPLNQSNQYHTFKHPRGGWVPVLNLASSWGNRFRIRTYHLAQRNMTMWSNFWRTEKTTLRMSCWRMTTIQWSWSSWKTGKGQYCRYVKGSSEHRNDGYASHRPWKYSLTCWFSSTSVANLKSLQIYIHSSCICDKVEVSMLRQALWLLNPFTL